MSMSPSSRSPSPRSAAADAPSKRKRSHSRSSTSRSPSPPSRRRRSVSPPPRDHRARREDGSRRGRRDRDDDRDGDRHRDREHQVVLRDRNGNVDAGADANEVAVKPKADLKAEMEKMANTRTGGAYIPPARLRAMMAEAAAADPASKEYQRLTWNALGKSIQGLINKVNTSNIKQVVPELFAENLIRGRGVFSRSIMRAQALSFPFTPVFASTVAVVNSKLPQVVELLVVRLISQFRRAFKRNDKSTCTATTMFIAHLVNQRVVRELLALQILVLLLEKPTDDSVEIAVAFMREVGAFLADEAPKANNTIFERFRAVLHEGEIAKRVQYMVEVLFQVRKDKYKDNPVIPEELDLVEEDDQITHEILLDDELNVEEGLNIFKYDPDYLEHEQQYKEIKEEILGEGSEEESGSGSEESGDESEDEEEAASDAVDIDDRTETSLINLRRTIYLTIMSSLDFEEGVHKLMKLDIKEGQEIELCNMIIECCSQERSYSKFYGLMGERFSKLNRVWTENFEQCFRTYYDTVHRYETNRLRNIARFFGHLIGSDSIPWTCFEVVKMNEEDTTSSSRIFIKILFQEMVELLGNKQLAERFNEPTMQTFYANMFPTDNPRSCRFSINYFTSIGLGVLTESMREHLKNAPKLIMANRRAALEDESSSSSDSDSDSLSDSDSDSDSLSSSSDYSSSYSGSYSSRSRSRTPPRRSRYTSNRSPSRSVSASRRSYSRSPPPFRSRRRSPTPDHSRRRSPTPDRSRRRSPSPYRSRRSPSPYRSRRRSPSSYRSPSPRRRRRSFSREPDRRRGSEEEDYYRKRTGGSGGRVR